MADLKKIFGMFFLVVGILMIIGGASVCFLGWWSGAWTGDPEIQARYDNLFMIGIVILVIGVSLLVVGIVLRNLARRKG